MLLGLVGVDVNSGAPRMTFDIADINDGIGFVPIAIGLFGIAEMIRNLEQPQDRELRRHAASRNLCPSRADLRAAFPAMLRGTAVGSVLGVLPGGGAALPPFSAYALEKKIVARPLALRQRRDRRRRRAGGRQQCRRADELRAAADARHSRQRR